MTNGAYAVVVTSIGTADPQSAVSIARGLNLNVSDTVRALYRAPAVIASSLTDAVADALCSLLKGLGFEADVRSGDPDAVLAAARAVAPAGAVDVPAAGALLDVAVHVTDPARFEAVCATVARFCGVPPDEAARLLMAPPGIVLGSVSQATADALQARLAGLGASVAAAVPEQSRFMLLAAPLPPATAARLRAELAALGRDVPAGSTIVASDLTHAEAARLWSGLGRTGQVRMVNTAFLRFDLLLEGLSPGAGWNATQAGALERLFGVPAGLFEAIQGALPVRLAEAVDSAALEAAMDELADLGLRTRADLAGFMPLAVTVQAAPDWAAAGAVLDGLGIVTAAASGPQGTCLASGPVPALLARVARARLEALGADVTLAEAG